MGGEEPFSSRTNEAPSELLRRPYQSEEHPCLYLAADEHTAMSEVRPWVGVMGTLGEFVTTRDLRLVNCTPKDTSTANLQWFVNEPSPEERERHVWRELNNSFSEPTSSTETTASYAPTQVLAETFRNAGFNGVVYNSSVAENGVNVALFDLASADVVACRLFQTAKLKYEFAVIN